MLTIVGRLSVEAKVHRVLSFGSIAIDVVESPGSPLNIDMAIE